jgi:hypothetical protein
MASVEPALSHTRVVSDHTLKGIKELANLRLVTGFVLILVSLVAVLGTDWDIQWHAVIGRDRTFTPPHDLILVGIGLTGVVALVNILIESNWVGRNPALQAYTTDFLDRLHSSLGSYLIGFGAVCSAVAFPLDTYWHSLYGVDVSLWAPFHTMIYMGSVLSTFGMVYLLISAAHLAESQNDGRGVRLGYAGAIASLGILLSKFCTFLIPAVTGHTLRIASFSISLFPVLLALCVVFVCVLAIRLVPWLGAASMVVLVFLLLWLLVSLFVPPMMTILVHAEHETYLAKASRLGSTVVPLLGQTPALLLPSLVLDGVAWLARRGKWKASRRNTWELVAVIVGMMLASAVTLALVSLSIHVGSGGVSRLLVLGLLLALLLSIPGSLFGSWLAIKIGAALHMLRR